MKKFTEKVIELAKNDHIQASTVSGICIIILAYSFKRVLHVEGTNLEAAIPGLVFTIYEGVRAKATRRILSRPLLWNIAMLLVTGLVIMRRAL